ncbi:MAG: DsbA family protein [Myxococcota bacterium]|nr:DsbA family protein [Myxococcota bacterium]
MLPTLLLGLLTACNDANNKSTSTANPIENTNGAPKTILTPTPKGESGLTMLTSSTTQVATWKGGAMKYEDLTTELLAELKMKEANYLNERYSFERGALEQKVMEEILTLEYKERNLASIEELIKAEVTDKAPEPTEQELRDFYEEVKSQARGATFEQIRPQLAMSLTQQKSQELMQALLGDLEKKYEVKYNMPFPDAARIEVSADDDPFLGTDGAPITIIQFAEFQCPYCGKAGESVDQVLKEYEGKVKMVYRDFPLSFHADATPAAIAANCAGEQGKYWEMYRLLMGNQRELKEKHLTGHAEALKLDLDKWNTCRKDPKQAAEVQKDFEDGQRVGVTGTPAFFINGIMLAGAVPFEQFKEIIDRELSN